MPGITLGRTNRKRPRMKIVNGVEVVPGGKKVSLRNAKQRPSKQNIRVK